MVTRPTYAKINTDSIKDNIKSIKHALNDRVMFCAVVKANAYGHGSTAVSRAALDAGADWLAVAMPEEAVAIRKSGINAPILSLGPVNAAQCFVAAKHDISIVAASVQCVENAIIVAKAQKKTMKLHIKVDTGMNRVGINSLDELGRMLDLIGQEKSLMLEGLMTHFANADDDDRSYTNMQTNKFKMYIDAVTKRGLSPIIHAANSAGTLYYSDASYDMVRCGISIYGYYPSEKIPCSVELKSALSLRTHISQIKKLYKGDKVSYSGTYTAEKDMLCATLPIGYADGLSRLLSNNGEVLLQGKRVPIIGRICMDQTLVDIGEVENAKLYDEVVCIGRQGDEEITMEEHALWRQTNVYEVLTGLSQRVPKLYYK